MVVNRGRDESLVEHKRSSKRSTDEKLIDGFQQTLQVQRMCGKTFRIRSEALQIDMSSFILR